MILNNVRGFCLKPLDDKAPDVLKAGIENIKGFDYWVSAGTVLGFYRDKDFIKGDTDIDVEMLNDGISKQDIIKAMKGFELIREIEHEGKPQQLAFIKNEVIFDIYFYKVVGDNIVNENEHGTMKVPYKFVKDLKQIKTKYGSFPAPSPIEEYLEYRYGKDWKTPSNKKGIYLN